MDDLGDLWWTYMMAKKAVQLEQIALILTDEVLLDLVLIQTTQ